MILEFVVRSLGRVSFMQLLMEASRPYIGSMPFHQPEPRSSLLYY